MWVAKCSNNLGKLFDYELSPRFEDIMECQKYIDDNLKDIERLLSAAFDKILYKHFVDGKVETKFCLSGNFIRCYNVEQERFCTGFDF